jgi:hypothetical protein
VYIIELEWFNNFDFDFDFDIVVADIDYFDSFYVYNLDDNFLAVVKFVHLVVVDIYYMVCFVYFDNFHLVDFDN